MKPNFEIELLEEAVEFLEKLDSKTRDKILYNFKKSQFKNDSELLKKLNDNIWEFRTLFNSKAYRFFAFWIKIDGKEKIIVASHGIIKSSQKTPTKEIKKAEEIRKHYIKNINQHE
jgi:phage-related protein